MPYETELFLCEHPQRKSLLMTMLGEAKFWLSCGYVVCNRMSGIPLSEKK